VLVGADGGAPPKPTGVGHTTAGPTANEAIGWSDEVLLEDWMSKRNVPDTVGEVAIERASATLWTISLGPGALHLFQCVVDVGECQLQCLSGGRDIHTHMAGPTEAIRSSGVQLNLRIRYEPALDHHLWCDWFRGGSSVPVGVGGDGSSPDFGGYPADVQPGEV